MIDPNMIDTSQAESERLFPVGTRLVKEDGSFYRYCRAAEGLKAGKKAYFGRSLPLFVHISATGKEDAVAGVPEVDVEPASYFWLRSCF